MPQMLGAVERTSAGDAWPFMWSMHFSSVVSLKCSSTNTLLPPFQNSDSCRKHAPYVTLLYFYQVVLSAWNCIPLAWHRPALWSFSDQATLHPSCYGLISKFRSGEKTALFPILLHTTTQSQQSFLPVLPYDPCNGYADKEGLVDSVGKKYFLCPWIKKMGKTLITARYQLPWDANSANSETSSI